MGFFESAPATAESRRHRFPVDMLHRQGCRLCSLDRAKGLESPKMQPSGADNPEVLCLGEAPGEEDDARGEPFVGNVGHLLKASIPRAWRGRVRYSNTIHCMPGRDEAGEYNDPTDVQLECCRPRIISDVERTKPKIILGFGNSALQWAAAQSRIFMWRGRRIPIKVGSHVCWFYPVFHPSLVLHTQADDWRRGNELEQVFRWDIQRAFDDLDTLPEPIVHTPADARKNLTLIYGDEPGALKKVREFLRAAQEHKRNGVDYETRGKRPYGRDSKILSIAVSCAQEAMAFAFHHREARWSKGDVAELAALWTEYLVSPVTKVSHGLGFELEWSGYMFGQEVVRASPWEDGMTQAAILDERVGDHKDGPLSLGWCSTECFGINIKKLSNVNRKDLDSEPIEAVLPYNAIDSRYHLWNFEYREKLIKQRGLVQQYRWMRERVPTVVLTQLKGISVDQDETDELSERYANQLAEIDYEISQEPEVKVYEKRTGEPFNAGSPKQVLGFFHSLGWYLENADEEALKSVDHPIAPAIIKHRKITKRRSTYVEAYKEEFEEIDQKTGRVQKYPGYLWPDGLLHPTFNIVFARSGRSSAEEPNVQNVLKHDEEGKEVRKQIKARPGHIYVSADQGQIQARNIAMESKDPVFCKMLWERYDIHKEWAERISRACPDAVGGKKNFTDKGVMGKFRQKTKNKWTFALFFNAQLPTLCSGMEIDEAILGPLFKEFWRIHGGIGGWHEDLYKKYKDTGIIQSAAGFQWHAPLSPNQIVNWPIQSDEAMVVFNGMSRLSETGNPLLQANMEIHDDLMFELPNKQSVIEDCMHSVVTEMLHCDFDWINVPLCVEVSTGKNWYEMKEIPDKMGEFWSDQWLGQPARPKYAM